MKDHLLYIMKIGMHLVIREPCLLMLIVTNQIKVRSSLKCKKEVVSLLVVRHLKIKSLIIVCNMERLKVILLNNKIQGNNK